MKDLKEFNVAHCNINVQYLQVKNIILKLVLTSAGIPWDIRGGFEKRLGVLIALCVTAKYFEKLLPVLHVPI